MRLHEERTNCAARTAYRSHPHPFCSDPTPRYKGLVLEQPELRTEVRERSMWGSRDKGTDRPRSHMLSLPPTQGCGTRGPRGVLV